MNQIARDKLIVRESMKMAFEGGEIWFEQLDSLNIYTDLVIEKFMNDLPKIRRVSSPSRVAVNINETLVDDKLADILIKEFAGSKGYVTKLAILGTDSHTKRLIMKMMKKYDINFAVAFINDYEKAKHWLVNEEY